MIIYIILLSRAARACSSGNNIVERALKFPHSDKHSIFTYPRRSRKDNEERVMRMEILITQFFPQLARME